MLLNFFFVKIAPMQLLVMCYDNKQLPVTLQNGNEVNREVLSPKAASSVCDSTKHNGLVTK